MTQSQISPTAAASKPGRGADATTAVTAAVLADRLTKRYRGARGVDDLSFAVLRGEVFGLLGPNGAGKTTTTRLILDLIRPTSGRLEVLGRDLWRRGVEIRRRLGYVPGDLRLYERLTARELVRYFASLRGLRGLGEAESVASRLDLELDRPIAALSKGNRQKVGLVQALMHRPELLILDEPTSGLDPLVQQVVHELLRGVVADGRTVILSSHVLSEVQQVADRVGVIRDGRLVVVERVESLRSRALARVEATFAVPPSADAFAGLPGVREQGRRGSVVAFALEGSIDPLLKALSRHEVIALDSHQADLEDVFLALYGKDDRAP